MPRLTIDGRSHDVTDGCTILQAADELGIEVPTVCHDPRIAPSGACRVCVVAVEGEGRPVAACTTPVRDGMVVHTRAPDIESLRRITLRMLTRQYPADALREFPDEPFHRLLHRYGLENDAAGRADPALLDTSHPTIRVDLSRCISCWRCVRICEEVQGQFVWRIVGRGIDTRIVPDSGTTLAESSCVACGACVDTCPSGALEDASAQELGVPTEWTRTTCPYCGVGCELLVGTREGRIVGVRPADDAPVNRGHLCVKGRYGFGFAAATDRVTHPMIREGGAWHEVSWDVAIAALATRLQEILESHGPSAIGVLGSARATNEDNYLIQKLTRTVLGTNNVDSCARVCHAPSAAALGRMLGTGAATSSFDDIERARTIFVCGSNTTENHPVVGARIKQAKLRGANLIVVDPRRIELAEYADIHLQPRPGTTVLLLNALASAVVDEGLVDTVFAADRVDGLQDFQQFIATDTPENVARACGVPASHIREAARLYALARPAIAFHGLGVTEHTQGTEGVMSLVNLALLTGNVGRPGSGVNPLRGQNNVQGAAHMGCAPGYLPGNVPVGEARGRFASVWRVDVPDAPGLDVMEMLDAAEAGRLKALWVVGWDILLTQPNTNATRRALANLDVLCVQDLFLNETAREFATVFLPAASAFEKDGTFMNSERRVQRVRMVTAAPGEAKPDWEIVCLIARSLGRGDLFEFDGPQQIWDEVRHVWAEGAGMTYTRLEAPGGLQWPCPDEDDPGTPLLHREVFPGLGRKAPLQQIAHVPTSEQPSEEFPLVLVTGRSLYQFNAGTMTGRSSIRSLKPTDALELSSEDAQRFDIPDGGLVVVSSRYGQATLPAEITSRQPPGLVFATFSDPATSLNQLTGSNRDAYTNTPEYKVTAVRVERATPTG